MSTLQKRSENLKTACNAMGWENGADLIDNLMQQRAELLEALKAAKKKGSRWNPADPVVQQINAAITRAEAAE